MTSFLEDFLSKNKIEDNLGRIILAPVTEKHAEAYNLLFWNPAVQFELDLTCPIHGENLYDTGQYSLDNTSAYAPRKLYDKSRNCLLISAHYRCSSCKNVWLAHSEQLTIAVIGKAYVPFKLYKKSGFVAAIYDEIVEAISRGKC